MAPSEQREGWNRIPGRFHDMAHPVNPDSVLGGPDHHGGKTGNFFSSIIWVT
jgi:hypothetical protein